MTVSEVTVTPIKPKFSHIAFASFLIYDTFYVSEVAVHTRPGGGIRLVYPRKRNRDMCHPIDPELGLMIQNAVEEYMESYGLI